MLINKNEIAKLIPHQGNISLIEQAWVASDYGIGYVKLEPEQWFFSGHFPGFPVFPGVLLIEAMAQTALIWQQKKLFKPLAKTFLIGIEKAKFSEPVLAKGILHLSSQLQTERLGFMTFECLAYVKENLISDLTKLKNPQAKAVIKTFFSI